MSSPPAAAAVLRRVSADPTTTGSCSPATGLVYVFNLIVGTGALTLPAAFHDAGWLLSTAVIVTLAFMSYLTTTFMIEYMAATNAMVHWKSSSSPGPASSGHAAARAAAGGSPAAPEAVVKSVQSCWSAACRAAFPPTTTSAR